MDKKYKTNNKKCIMNYIEKFNDSFTIKELYNEIIVNNNIGLTTIYRFIDELLKKDILKKDYNENNIATYQLLEKCEKGNHFYLKCNNCGKLIHIDCDCILELQNHILINHQFKIDKNTIISGLCNKCKGEN